MSDVVCYWCELTNNALTMLRRYHSSSDAASRCPLPHGYHDASITLEGQKPWPEESTLVGSEIRFSHDDPRWPKACPCGYVFPETDEWQAMDERLYKRSDTGAVLLMKDMAPGAMWNATWYLETGFIKSPDGIALCVKLPDGTDWLIDGHANNSNVIPAWTRTGTPPKITARPSILTPGYHGFLTDGVLTSC